MDLSQGASWVAVVVVVVMVVVGRGGWWAFAAFADLRRASHGHASTCVIGGDHNAKVPFALSAAPWRTNGQEHARRRARARARARESTRKSTRVWCVCVSPTRASFLCVPLHPHHTAPHTTPHHTTSHHTTPPCPAFLPAPGAADGVNGTWRCGQCVCVCVGVGVGARVVLW